MPQTGGQDKKARRRFTQTDLCNSHFLSWPATLGEASLSYSNDQADRVLDTVGHVRIDPGFGGSGFYHTWWSHNEDQSNTPGFKEALRRLMDAIRADGLLKNLFSMDRFCRQNDEAITEDGRGYGYLAEMGSYCFCLRCTSSPGEYQYYLYCCDLRQRTLNRPVGWVTSANGEHMELTAPQNYFRTIHEELSTKNLIGFRFGTLTDDPTVYKAVDDIVYDLYGEENPRPLEDYTFRQRPSLRELSI